MATYPGLMTRQQMAVGGPIKRRKPAREAGLKAYLQGMAPIARSEKHRKKVYDQWLAEQERLATEHAEGMDVKRQELETSQKAAEEEQRIARESLVLGRKAQRETEKQAKHGLILRGISTALQAFPLFGGKKLTTPRMPGYGQGGSGVYGSEWSSGEPPESGAGGSISFDISDTCTCLTFLYGLFSPQVRYAKVFCGRFMDLPTLLGYYQVAAKTVRIWRRYPMLIWPMTKCFVEPACKFMLWKLGRRERISAWTRLWAKMFLWLCKKQEQRRQEIMVLPRNFEKCINMVKGR